MHRQDPGCVSGFLYKGPMPLPPVSEVLKELADAADAYAIAVQAYDGGLMLGTEASGERGQEGRLLTESSPGPVAVAHSAIRLGHFYILDCYRTLARLTVLELPSVYGPFIIGRSLLDTAGGVNWLAESGIGAERRAQRALVRNLAEGNQQSIPARPEFQPVRDRIRHDREEAESLCGAHGWYYRPGNRRQSPKVGDEALPTARRLIGALLDQDLNEIERDLGATLWWWLCGFTHGSLDALLHTLDRNATNDPSQPSGVINVRADSFVWLLVACGRAVIAVTGRRQHLFGESDPGIIDKTQALQAEFARYVTAVAAGRLP